jgi:nucleoside-diphosphate-sugar epimerase
MIKGCRGADVVFHLAAKVTLEGPWEEYQRDNVDGTRLALEAAEESGVQVFVNCGTEALLLGEGPLIMADETRPYSKTPAGPYSKSKGIAEDLCLKADKPGFRVVSVRPRFIWGRGDTVLGPSFAQKVKDGEWVWFGGGDYLTSTTNIDNCIEGLLCAAARGKGGNAYFVTDGEPVKIRDFVTAYVQKWGVDPSNAWNFPLFMGKVAEWIGRAPPHSSQFFLQEVTLSDAKARRDIGYKGKVSVKEGLDRMEVVDTWAPSKL